MNDITAFPYRKNPKLKVALVYQGSMANVFEVDEFFLGNIKKRNTQRVMYDDFHTCECYCRGVIAAGGQVLVASCNEEGEIRERPWSNCMDDAPSADKAIPVCTEGLHWMW